MTPLTIRRKIILLLTGITTLLGIALAVRRYAGMPAPDFVLPAGGQPGVLGPLILDFQQAVAQEKVEPYLSVEPDVPGTWRMAVLMLVVARVVTGRKGAGRRHDSGLSQKFSKQ